MAYSIHGFKPEEQLTSVGKILKDIDKRLKCRPVEKRHKNPVIIPFYIEDGKREFAKFVSPIAGNLKTITLYITTTPAVAFSASISLHVTRGEEDFSRRYKTNCNVARDLQIALELQSKDLITASLADLQIPAEYKDQEITVNNIWCSFSILDESSAVTEIIAEEDADA